MAFNILIKDDKMTLQLKGNVDLSETNDIKTALGAEPKAGFKFLTIQGEGLEYIDSSGVALMLFTKKLANEQNLMFEVESLSDNAQTVINLAGLANILKVKNIPKTEEATPTAAPNAAPSQVKAPEADLSLDFAFDDLLNDVKESAPAKSTTDTDPIKINPGSF